MDRFNKPKDLSKSPNKEIFRLPLDGLTDKAKVQLGGFSPTFRKLSLRDKGKVRLGGFGPIFRA